MPYKLQFIMKIDQQQSSTEYFYCFWNSKLQPKRYLDIKNLKPVFIVRYLRILLNILRGWQPALFHH